MMHARLRWLFASTACALCVDLAIAFLARAKLAASLDNHVFLPSPAITLGDHVFLQYVSNPGEAFGFAASHPWFVRIIVTISAMLFIDSALHAARRALRARGLMIGFGVILAARLASAIERLVIGAEPDYLGIRFGHHQYPLTNLESISSWVAGVGVGVAMLVLVPQSMYWTRRISAFRSRRAIAGTGLRALTVLILAGSGGFASVAMIHAAGLLGDVTTASPSVAAIFTILAAALFLAAGSLQVVGRRLQQPQLEELLASDPRRPVVLLRSFQRDRKRIRRRGRLGWLAVWRNDYLLDAGPWTFERPLVAWLEKVGPVIALGAPGEALQPLGASRGYVPHAEWKERVTELTTRAALCVLIVEDTPSVRWELARVVEQPGLPHVLLIPAAVVSPGANLASWDALRADFHFLPAIDAATAAVMFDRDAAPVRVTATGRRHWPHLDALEAVLTRLAMEPR